MHISSEMIYLGDNGVALCGDHLGATAKATGCDLSGCPILPVTPDVARQAIGMGYLPECEHCGKKPSLLILAGV